MAQETAKTEFQLLMAMFKKYEIKFLDNNLKMCQLGFGKRYKDYYFEPHLNFRNGKYDILNIGAYTYLGGGETIIKKVNSIGRFCAIAGNVKTGLFEHPTDNLSIHHMFHSTTWKQTWGSLNNFYEENYVNISKAKNLYEETKKPNDYSINIGNDVWIGENTIIMNNINIGNGAIVAAGAVVTKDVPDYAIVGGVPAKIIKYRFEEKIIKELLTIKWWDYGLSILKDVDFTNIEVAITQLKKNIETGVAKIYKPNQLIYKIDRKLEENK